MRQVLHVHRPSYASDYAAIATNGLAYGRESSGYHEWIKKGVPEPEDPRTVLTELRSPVPPPVMWATGGWVGIPTSFLVTDATRALFEDHSVTGIDWAPVRVVKVATKAGASRRAPIREPEDQILGNANQLETVGPLPVLWAVRIVILAEVLPDAGVWDKSASKIQPYHFVDFPEADFWHAARDGAQYGGHVFCSARFRTLCEDHQVTNIAFTAFSEWNAQAP